ncbi:MAG TPA: hypothetical protein VF859_07360, partial [Burkholderiales bacterium]
RTPGQAVWVPPDWMLRCGKLPAGQHILGLPTCPVDKSVGNWFLQNGCPKATFLHARVSHSGFGEKAMNI